MCKQFSRRTRTRRAFTLLEVTLAVAISVMLVLALYFAMSAQVDHARTAREVIDEATIMRSFLTRINVDVAGIQGPINPYLNASNAYGANTSTITSTGTSSSSSGSSSSSSGSSSSSSGSGSSSGSSTTTTTNVVNVTMTNIGVIGQSDSVVFTVTRMSTDVTGAIAGGDPLSTPQCDIRRITYAVTEHGLVRKEDANVFDGTFQPGESPSAGIGDAKDNVIAPQVTKMQIQYYGNGGWASEWNSANTDSETSYSNSTTSVQYYTQQGPPTAIQFTFTLKLPASSRSGGSKEVTVTQVVAIPTANRSGPMPPPPTP